MKEQNKDHSFKNQDLFETLIKNILNYLEMQMNQINDSLDANYGTKWKSKDVIHKGKMAKKLNMKKL